MSVATKTRIPLAEAEALANEVVELLSPYCERIAIAGSIRRRSETVGDVEVVAVPRYRNDGLGDLFGEIPAVVNLLDERCAQLLVLGTFGRRLDKNGRPAVGSGYKRLTYRDFALDLFAVIPPAQWGVIYTIRTGPSDFSRRLVTQRMSGGLCPDGMRVKDGRLWRLDGHWDDPEAKWHGLETPEEMDVFREMGLGWMAPEER